MSAKAALVVCLALPVWADPSVNFDVDIDLAVRGGLDTNPRRLDDVSRSVAMTELDGALRLATTLGEKAHVSLSTRAGARHFEGQASDADVAVVAGKGQIERSLAARPLSLGASLEHYETFEHGSSGQLSARDFRASGASVFSRLGTATRSAVATFGYRSFEYKPNPAFDFACEHAGVTVSKSVSLSDDTNPQSLAFSLEYRLQHRRYDERASHRVAGCTEADCRSPTDIPRSDLFHLALAEAMYVGEFLANARYEFHTNQSNSFGESLQRHRLELGATSETWLGVVLTGRVTLQWVRFVDSRLFSGDVGTFVSIEDEGRSALHSSATRELWPGIALEARYAYYTNALVSSALAYRRQTATVGISGRFGK